MTRCYKCKNVINDGDERKHNSKVLCEECYLDEIVSPVRKMYYEHSSSFMLRLKDSYISNPQKFH